MKRVVVAVLAALSLSACVSLRSYRTNPPYGPVEQPPFQDQYQNDIYIGFVELDDHGLFWTTKELQDSMEMIETAAQPNGAIVAVFVHGWLNNARYPDEDNGDLDNFKNDVLKVMSQHETVAARREGRPRRNVVGVYVAWRGLSIKPKLLSWTSFYNRKDAALRVADTQATVTLHGLIAKTREDPRSQILVIGHSFGGLITERALGPVLITEAMRMRTGPVAGSMMDTAPDLVVLVNPATNATRALGDVWTLKESPALIPPRRTRFYMREQVSRTPLIVSLTSATDQATGLAFPAAEYLEGLFQSFRGWGGTPMEGVFPSERTVYAKTMGHLPQIWSHDVTFTQLPETRTDAATEPAAPCRAGESSGEICFVVGRDQFTMTPRAGRFNDTHYWIMQLPKSIVNGHSDIWNPVWVNMLIGMMESLGPSRR